MSPPDVWGPPIWRFFHILAENIHEEDYDKLIPQLFTLIRRTCVYLPCPECSEHATSFLAKIAPSNIPNKTEFKNMLYLFHNMVNKKKRKPLFDYSNLKTYKNINIFYAFNQFSIVYNTRGNMRTLTESFQRQFIIRDFKYWIKIHAASFYPRTEIFLQNSNNNNNDNNNNNNNNNDNNNNNNNNNDNSSINLIINSSVV